jgi:DNA-binding response OmpR family regulator
MHSAGPVTAGERELLCACNPPFGILEAVRVLIVEDQRELAATIAVGLRREGMAVDLAFDGEEGLHRTERETYDVVVLDRDLPKVHGDQVCQTLIARGSPSPVLMLTAADAIEDRVDGLGLGADDYLSKPFAFAELVARIRALARRTRPALAPILEAGDIRLDTVRRLASRAGRRLELSAKELAVLEVLLAADGAPVSAAELLRRAWDQYANRHSNVVKVTVLRLRRKLGEPPAIETIPHIGYRICT